MFIDFNLTAIEQFSQDEQNNTINFQGNDGNKSYIGKCYGSNEQGYNFYLLFKSNNESLIDYIALKNVKLINRPEHHNNLSFQFQSNQNSEIILDRGHSDNPNIDIHMYNK